MSLPRYPEYKASGVEWLGEVPGHWEVLPVKNVANIVNGHPFDSKLFDPSEGYPLVRIRDLDCSSSDTYINGEFVEQAAITSADVLIGMDGDFNVGRWRGENVALLNQRMCCVRGKSEVVTRLLEYALPIPLKAINEITYATTVKHLSSSQVEKTCVALPCDEHEQSAIAAFLDCETGKIDALIAEQRRLVELLAEKRQAVISHAVTKGLPSTSSGLNAKMKNSGIEWLGEVPEHWRVGAIKYFVLAKNGAIKTGPFGSHLISSDMQSGTIKVYNQRSVIDGDFDSGDNFISEEKFAELASFETFPGDLLITTRGTIGRAAILPENAERGILHPCLLRLQPDTSHIDTKFLKTLIQDSDLMKTQLSYLSNATTIEVIYSYTIASVIIPVPPLAEQNAIMKFLADETAKFDTLTAEANRAIELLKERRSALISAAVTGKIDVRGVCA